MDTRDQNDGHGPQRQISYARAYNVETVIIAEKGQWAVDIVVVFDDEVVRKRIDSYRTERLAQISADLIRRTAEREITGPIHG